MSGPHPATARPWRLHPHGIPYVNCGERGCSFGPVVLAGTVEEMQANAELIVHAVNAHDDLVAALRAMVYEATHLSPPEDDGSHWCRITKQTLDAARAALAKAEGRQQ